MNRKSILIAISVLIILFISYKIACKMVNDSVDDSNKRAVELYANSIKYAYAKSYLNGNGTGNLNVDDLNVKISADINCDEKKVNEVGDVELKGCVVDNSKRKYKYVKGKAEVE